MFKTGQFRTAFVRAFSVLALVVVGGSLLPLESYARDKGKHGKSCVAALTPAPFQQALQKARQPHEIKSLRLMSYNVEEFFLTGKGQNRKPSDDVREITEVILESNPDLLLMVELGEERDAHRFASEHLGGAYQVRVIPGNDHIKLALFIKSDLPFDVEVVTHRHLTWVDPTDGDTKPLFSRDLPAFVFRRKGSPQATPSLILFGNHARSMKDRDGDPNSSMLRTAQHEAAAQIIRDFMKRYGTDVPLAIAGDFNTDVRSSNEIDALREDLVDAFDLVKLPREDRVTHTFHPKRNRADAKQLDAIMVNKVLRPSVVKAEVYRYKNHSGETRPIPRNSHERQLNPSDHFPVIIDLSTEPIIPEAHPNDFKKAS